MRILVADHAKVWRMDPDGGGAKAARGLDGARPTCLATGPPGSGTVWCGTRGDGLYRSADAGASFAPAALAGRRVTAVSVAPGPDPVVWAGTEPSEVWRTVEGEGGWERAEGLRDLPSSSEWSFPPRPETDHVRWIACHPHDAGRIWVAVEAGALVTSPDGGRSWRDRVPGGPRDSHEIAVHPDEPDTLRVAAGDGYFESRDGGQSWESPEVGLEVGYLRSVAVDPGDPGRVLVSGASRPRTAYAAGSADGRLWRRTGEGAWERVTDGWPDPPDTIAPLLVPGERGGELWAADERGLHRSTDGGERWGRVAAYPRDPDHLRGLAVVAGA